MPLANKVALVTGAASGIGKATALAFAAAGSQVAASDLSLERLEAVRSELAARGTPGAVFIAGDVSSPDDIERIVAETVRAVGPIDILCNVAGVLDRWLLAHELPIEIWRHVMAVNLTAPYLFAHEVLPSMMERRAGVIVIVSSTAGLGGGRAGAAYTASKHGALGLAANIGVSYGAFGIRCVAVCPGAVGQRTGDVPGERSELGAAMVGRLSATRPPSASPDAIAKGIVFIASDDASHINATSLVIDGGWSET